MYATAHQVANLSTGEEGLNGFLHLHGDSFLWPAEPWLLPESDPGELVWEHVELRPGGNRVRSYLDVLCPDPTTIEEVETALNSLWLELVTDETGSSVGQGSLPNPVIYKRGAVVLRFGVEMGMKPNWSLAFSTLRKVIAPAMAMWSDRLLCRRC